MFYGFIFQHSTRLWLMLRASKPKHYLSVFSKISSQLLKCQSVWARWGEVREGKPGGMAVQHWALKSQKNDCTN